MDGTQMKYFKNITDISNSETPPKNSTHLHIVVDRLHRKWTIINNKNAQFSVLCQYDSTSLTLEHFDTSKLSIKKLQNLLVISAVKVPHQ